MMRCSIIKPDDSSWGRILEKSDYDIYHLPCYSRLEGSIIGGEAKAFMVSDGSEAALVPFLKRKITFLNGPDIKFDAVSPYGFPGILFTRNFSLTNFDNFLESLKKCGFAEGLVSTFIRLHPLFNKMNYSSNYRVRFLRIGSSVVVNCSPDMENIFVSFSTNHKKNIKKLIKNGAYTEIDNWSDYNDFQHLYKLTMSRVSAKDYYYHDQYYFRNLRKCLKDKLHLITVKDKFNKILSAGLFSGVNSLGHSIYTASDPDSLRLAPSKLLFYGMIKWCSENNIDRLNLGGGVCSLKDSLFDFKMGFGHEVYNFNGFGIINDIRVYNKLADNYNTALHAGKFFPFYRVGQDEDAKIDSHIHCAVSGINNRIFPNK